MPTSDSFGYQLANDLKFQSRSYLYPPGSTAMRESAIVKILTIGKILKIGLWGTHSDEREDALLKQIRVLRGSIECCSLKVEL